jgi:hypothetical protein
MRTCRIVVSTFGLATGASFVFGAGCTFLVPFEDAPAETGSDTRPSGPREGGTVAPPNATESGSNDPPPNPGNCDPFPKANEIKGCAGIVENGQVCGDSHLLEFPKGFDASAYVVTCSKRNGAICVKECTGPGKCAHLPNSFPDACDQCQGKVGRYCGRDMLGWPNANFGLLVVCNNDRMESVVACDAGCDSGTTPGSAFCTPR